MSPDAARTPSVVLLRYLLAFGAEVIVSTRDRLSASGLRREGTDRLHAAWTKAVILTVTLWVEALCRGGRIVVGGKRSEARSKFASIEWHDIDGRSLGTRFSRGQ